MTSASEKLLDPEAMTSYARDWKASGKKVMAIYCCHVPEEILYAADILPYRLKGVGCKDTSGAETYMSNYSCSFARTIFQKYLDGELDFLDGIVGTDSCMMMERVYDNIMEIHADKNFVLHSFHTPKVATDRAVEHYMFEINELKETCEKLSGVKVTKERLANAIKVYNRTRELIQKLYDMRKDKYPRVTGTEVLKVILAGMSMPKDKYNELLEEYIEEVKAREPITDYKARLLVVGSSLDDPDYLKIFEDRGGLFVTDHQCFGTRYLWEPVPLEDEDLIHSIADTYLRRPVCPRMFDLNLRYELSDHIVEVGKKFNVDGVVFVKMRNCDIWGGEGYFMNDKIREAGMQVLELEREEIVQNPGQVGIRAEAFLEMIEGGR